MTLTYKNRRITRPFRLQEFAAARVFPVTTDPGPDGLAQLTGRTMCDRIVVFDAPLRLIGRMVDVDIISAGAWSLAGDVADDLANAVPLDHLEQSGPAVHQIRVPAQSPPQIAQRS